MGKSGLALAREREKQMMSRMAEILEWDNEDLVVNALKRLGVVSGSDEFDEAMAIWRDLR